MSRKRLLVNKITVLILMLLVVSGIGGCDKKPKNVSDDTHVVFTDALGRKVAIQKNPKRVAALIGSFADVWQLSGGEVCASADDAWDDFNLDLEGAVNIGKTKEPNLEKILSSNPDFVIASSATAADVEMLDVFENAGISVAYFDVACFDDYLNMLDVCTSITGRKDLYQKNGIEIKTAIEDLKKEFFKIKIPEEEKTVLFLRASSGYIRAKNSDGSILGEMLNELGCKNIADSDALLLENLNIESIIKSNPYRIFIVQVGDDENAVKENMDKMMNENPAWRELDAVKNNRIYYMDKQLFNLKPNARWGESYEILCKILQE